MANKYIQAWRARKNGAEAAPSASAHARKRRRHSDEEPAVSPGAALPDPPPERATELSDDELERLTAPSSQG